MTDATNAPARSDPRTRRNVAVLVGAQAILGSQMPMLFVVGGLVGNTLTPNPCLATLPISMIVFGSMTTAPWISPLMQRQGRRNGFIIGALAGALGAAVAGYGLYIGSFLMLLLGSYISGIYMSAQGFYRFAAADGASEQFRPKAISYVMAGGLMSAIIGPQLNKVMFDFSVIPFLGSYVAIVVLNLVGLFLFFLLDLPNAAALAAAKTNDAVRSKLELLKTPRVAVAIICGMVSYALMNLVMTSTPLAVMGCGFEADSANDIVSAHMLAMFVPSFFTGHLINRFGVEKIVATGLVILGLAGAVALTGVTLANFFIALILLGLGWNFGFIGATTMLASSHTVSERGVVQGLNDSIVFGCVTLASLASGGLMNCSGGSAVEGWNAVNIAMIPFLTLAGGALIWLALRPKSAR
ncbi:Predicted arabinose efflux permease, MFS family [Litoreibacter ascidiaceicola]|uniref:Predicted arabinose efflux permease, MFS family n=1 Tax=Litoreibacter ascidiaceicola TaxID=1486859 RepID=A0A1M4SF71_9RHOB|nr:MFS transporter [Litoreibacter ascidiaceicola]SHE30873.1 Predicted arabinose efflux permease, MFS family [Litoreibacter ascidiaceicola]